MISILSYLNQNNAKPRDKARVDPTQAFGALSVNLLDGILRQVLSGEGFGTLRRELEETRESLLRAETAEQISRVEATVARILAQYRADTQQAAMAQAVEVQHIFAMLNHALIVMAEGRDRSVSRLSEIQDTLQRTSRIPDIVALKSALADTVKFVERESAEAKIAISAELARLESEVGEAREFLSGARGELAGHADGVARIKEAATILGPGQAVYALVYLCDRLTGITQRYGAAVTEEFIFRIIRERLQPIHPSAMVYRWTSSGLVAVFVQQRDLAALQDKLAPLNRTPIVHRAALGNRTAVLTLAPSHLLLESGPGGAAQMLEQVDRFTRAESQG
jgi:hypothetical protein